MRVQYVDKFREGDAAAVLSLAERRLGSGFFAGWKPTADQRVAVVRDERGIAACLLYRVSPDGEEIWADQLEGWRDEPTRPTLRGIRAMKMLGDWLEDFGRTIGARRVISPVHYENGVHERTLEKLGYSEFVHLWRKDL